MTAEQQLDVIAVGAHPDDVEIGCGGTVASLVDRGYRVGIVDLTDGEPTPLSPHPDVRRAEARRAAETLGVHYRHILDFPNRRLFDTFEARVALAVEFRRWRPTLVLALGSRTPLASPDHWQARLIIEAAVFYSRLTKWDDQFAGLPPHAIEHLAYYPLGFDSVALDLPGHRWVQDISGSLDRKMAAIRCYETQFPPAKTGLLSKIEHAARFIGLSAGFEAGEQIVSPRVPATDDLLAALARKK